MSPNTENTPSQQPPTAAPAPQQPPTTVPEPQQPSTPPPPLAQQPPTTPPPPLPQHRLDNTATWPDPLTQGSPAAVGANATGRPRWGIADLILSVPFILGLSVVGLLAASLVASATGNDLSLTSPEVLPAWIIVIAGLIQQGAQFLWPWIVSRLKGLGMASDWGFKFDLPKDLGIGVALGAVCVPAGSALSYAVAKLLDVNLEDSSNTTILSDNVNDPWLIGIIFMVVIGAPLTEELLYRGLVLRIIEKYSNLTVATIVSTIIFTVVHYQAQNSFTENLVLFSSIGTVGAVLGIITARTGRLGPAIIAHFVFNSFGTLATLASGALQS